MSFIRNKQKNELQKMGLEEQGQRMSLKDALQKTSEKDCKKIFRQKLEGRAVKLQASGCGGLSALQQMCPAAAG